MGITTRRLNERGMASFIVVFVMMLIISLIVLSFARIVRHEQVQVLDRQLSSRAYYSAESGVNTALSKLKQGRTVSKTDCSTDSIPPPLGVDSATEYTLDAASDTSISCLMIDTSPPILVYDPVDIDTALVVPLNIVNSAGVPTPAQTVTITWTGSGASANFSGCPAPTTQPAVTGWGTCPAPIMRADLVPNNALDRASYQQGENTFFMRPLASGSGAYSYKVAGLTSINAENVGASCSNSTGVCQVAINVTAVSTPYYYLRLLPLYMTAHNVTITAVDAAGNHLEFSGAQALVDSTGRAQDVVRRIQVRIPITGAGAVSNNYAATPAGACKQAIAYANNIQCILCRHPY